MPYVTESIKRIRDELTSTLQRLGPDSEARVWIEQLRAACREYLTATETRGGGMDDWADVQPALAQLREAFLRVANHAAAYYKIPAARELANEMAKHSDDAAPAPATQAPVTPRVVSHEPSDLLFTIEQMLERLETMKSGPLRSVNAGIYADLLRGTKEARPDHPLLATLSPPAETAMRGIYSLTVAEAQTGLTLMRSALLNADNAVRQDLVEQVVAMSRRLLSSSPERQMTGSDVCRALGRDPDDIAVYHAFMEARDTGQLDVAFPGGMALPSMVRIPPRSDPSDS